ncbi:EthD family reductase [Rhodobacteraceae bacterium D3-12]|nr:EthD family reductase [Rhodobacteraceae bacterium D3-12]
MPVTLQVIYPFTEGTSFDMDYYLTTHMQIVQDHMGQHIKESFVTKGISGGPNTPPPYHAIATIVFPDQEAMNAAVAGSGALLKDIPNFTDVRPKTLIGELVG